MLHIKCHLKWAISFHSCLYTHVTSWKSATNTNMSYLAKDIRMTCQITQPAHAHAQRGTYELADTLTRSYLSHWNPDSRKQLLQPYQSALKAWQEEYSAKGMNAQAKTSEKCFLTDVFLSCQCRCFSFLPRVLNCVFVFGYFSPHRIHKNIFF